MGCYLQRSLSAQVNGLVVGGGGGGCPDANTDRLKQSISAVRASGGFPCNVIHRNAFGNIVCEMAAILSRGR